MYSFTQSSLQGFNATANINAQTSCSNFKPHFCLVQFLCSAVYITALKSNNVNGITVWSSLGAGMSSLLTVRNGASTRDNVTIVFL